MTLHVDFVIRVLSITPINVVHSSDTVIVIGRFASG
jgi:hypothetical protein